MSTLLTSLKTSLLLLALGAAQTRIGVERSVGTVSPSMAVGEQRNVSLVFGGGQYLAVWQDAREGRNFDIYAARLAADGTLKDQAGLRVAATDGDDVRPRAAFDGTNFLVVWEQQRQGDADILAARMDGSGKVLDATPLVVSSASYDQGTPAVAFDGQRYLVVWADCRNDGPGCLQGAVENVDVYGTLVATDGTVMHPQGVVISNAAGAQSSPSVAASSGEFLVGWKDFRSGNDFDIWAARLDASGAVLDPAGIPVVQAPSIQQMPAVAFNGNDYVVAWEDRRSGTPNVYVARMDRAGAVKDVSGIALHPQGATQFELALACATSECLVTWHDHRSSVTSLVGARLSAQGTVLDAFPPPLTFGGQDPSRPSLASDGQGYLMGFEDQVPGEQFDVSLAVLDGQLNPLGANPRPLAAAGTPQQLPSLARVDGGYVLVWQERRDPTHFDIMASFIADDGQLRFPQGVPVANQTTPESTPAVAHDGQRALVVWAEGSDGRRDVWGTFLDTQLTSSPFLISGGTGDEWHPSVAFSGEHYLVSWSDRRGFSVDIYAARILPDGQLLDPSGLKVSSGGFDETEPHVSSQGWVTWVEETAPPQKVLRTARVAPDAGVLVLASPPANAPRAPALSAGDAKHLLSWVESAEVRGVLLDAQGNTVGNPLSLPAWGGAIQLLRAGGRWLLSGEVASDAGSALQTVEVFDDGGVSEPLIHLDHPLQSPALATDERGLFVIAYSRFDFTPQVMNPRVRWRFIATQDAGLPDSGMDPFDAGSPSDSGVALRFLSTAPAEATCGEPYLYGPQVDASATPRLWLEQAPAGMSLDANGRVTWVPTFEQQGDHTFTLRAAVDQLEEQQVSSLTVQCPGTRTPPAGCGCHGGAGLCLGLVAWLVGLGRRRNGGQKLSLPVATGMLHRKEGNTDGMVCDRGEQEPQ